MRYKYNLITGVERVKTKLDLSKTLMGFIALALPATMYLSAGGALAASGYSLFGDANIVTGGNPGKAVQIRSDADPGFGGISYTVAPGTTFATLDVLSTDFMPEVDDVCVGGSPRFSIGIDSDGDGDRDGSIWAYLGIDSGSPACVPGVWQNSTDLLETGKFVDSSQLTPGTQINPYTVALATYGSMAVTSISLVTDSGWAHSDGEQTFKIDNTNIDGVVYNYDQPSSKDECKQGEWMTLTDQNGNAFKNQGQCVSWTNGRGQ